MAFNTICIGEVNEDEKAKNCFSGFYLCWPFTDQMKEVCFISSLCLTCTFPNCGSAGYLDNVNTKFIVNGRT